MLAGILGSLPSPLLCVVFQDCTTPVAPPWDVRNSVYSLKTLPLRVSSIPVRRGDFESLKMEQRRLNVIRSGAATFIDNRYSDFCCTFSYCQRLHSFSSKCPKYRSSGNASSCFCLHGSGSRTSRKLWNFCTFKKSNGLNSKLHSWYFYCSAPYEQKLSHKEIKDIKMFLCAVEYLWEIWVLCFHLSSMWPLWRVANWQEVGISCLCIKEIDSERHLCCLLTRETYWSCKVTLAICRERCWLMQPPGNTMRLI